ncbi:hypothetical protein ES703_35994 [subsurface metagenome]
MREGKKDNRRRHFNVDIDRSCPRVVGVQYIAAPDAQSRIAKVISILLRAAARHATLSEKSAKAKRGEQAPVEDASTDGGKEGDPG